MVTTHRRALAVLYGGQALLAFALAGGVLWAMVQQGLHDPAAPWLALALLSSLGGGIASLVFLVLLLRQETWRAALALHASQRRARR